MRAEDIRNLRASWGLSQALFAKLLDIGEATLQRYERGSLPSLSLHALLRRASTVRGLRDLVEEAKARISPEEYRTAVHRLESVIREQGPSQRQKAPGRGPRDR